MSLSKLENTKRKGLVHIYTGNGKGKTSAALGLVMRAKGHNLNVCWVSFHKHHSTNFYYGEYKILKQIGVDVFRFVKYCKIHNPYKSEQEFIENARKDCLDAIKFITEKIYKNNYDVIVLDEILISLREGFLNEDEIINLIKTKPEKSELILTGRCDEKLNKIINFADYVSNIESVKHPYDKKIERRKGIEY